MLALGSAAAADSDGAFSVYRAGPVGRVALDPSGVVKGWAAERAAGPLRRLAGTDFCLSAGAISSAARRPGRPTWRIGIEDTMTPAA